MKTIKAFDAKGPMSASILLSVIAQLLGDTGMEELGSPSSSLPPVANRFSDRDLAMAKSRALTREEVLRRRLRQVKQLARFYRSHYWALMHEVKSKYREYYWTYGKSPFENDHKNNGPNQNVNASNGNKKVTVGSDGGLGDDFVSCAYRGCKSKAMALTRYCRNHILADSKQKLYRGCNAVAKSSATGPSICFKPVLRSMLPPACPTHFRLGKKFLIQAVRRAGYAIPTNCNLNPKFHVLVAEFVRQIQIKRKAALKATVSMVETEWLLIVD